MVDCYAFSIILFIIISHLMEKLHFVYFFLICSIQLLELYFLKKIANVVSLPVKCSRSAKSSWCSKLPNSNYFAVFIRFFAWDFHWYYLMVMEKSDRFWLISSSLSDSVTVFIENTTILVLNDWKIRGI